MFSLILPLCAESEDRCQHDGNTDRRKFCTYLKKWGGELMSEMQWNKVESPPEVCCLTREVEPVR